MFVTSEVLSIRRGKHSCCHFLFNCNGIIQHTTYSGISHHFVLLRDVKVKCKGLPQQAEMVQEVPGRLRPQIFLDIQHYEGGRSSALCTSRLYPRRNPWYSFLEAESTPGHKVPSVAMGKIPSD